MDAATGSFCVVHGSRRITTGLGRCFLNAHKSCRLASLGVG